MENMLICNQISMKCNKQAYRELGLWAGMITRKTIQKVRMAMGIATRTRTRMRILILKQSSTASRALLGILLAFAAWWRMGAIAQKC